MITISDEELIFYYDLYCVYKVMLNKVPPELQKSIITTINVLEELLKIGNKL